MHIFWIINRTKWIQGHYKRVHYYLTTTGVMLSSRFVIFSVMVHFFLWKEPCIQRHDGVSVRYDHWIQRYFKIVSFLITDLSDFFWWTHTDVCVKESVRTGFKILKCPLKCPCSSMCDWHRLEKMYEKTKRLIVQNRYKTDTDTQHIQNFQRHLQLNRTEKKGNF